VFLPVLFADFVEIGDNVLHEVLRIGLLGLLLSILLSLNLVACPLVLEHSLPSSPLGLILLSGGSSTDRFIRVQLLH